MGYHVLGALIVSVLIASASVRAQNTPQQECAAVPAEQSTKAISSGVTVTWEDSFICADPASAGTYQITALIANTTGSVAAVEINGVLLSHTTPRRGPPRAGAERATATGTGLPVTLQPGQSTQIIITGTYTLQRDDDDGLAKLNLHLRLSGRATTDERSFQLPINVHLTPLGADDGESRNEGDGPPAAVCERRGVPGPPPWVCERR